MVIRVTKFVVVLACALVGATTNGAQFPPIAFLSIGFKEATMVDFASSPQVSARRADASGYLAVSADFDGDGEVDEARVLLNEQRKVAYVVAVIQSPSKVDTYVLSQMPLEDAKNVGITLAKPLEVNQSRGLCGVKIFALDSGQGEASYFDGEEFNTQVTVAATPAKAS
nr:hypothetical protein [Polymorphobacter sp.]